MVRRIRNLVAESLALDRLSQHRPWHDSGNRRKRAAQGSAKGRRMRTACPWAAGF